jgi:hypothetical protein
MAELGAAASIIGIVSLAVQVSDSILKLKSFCELVKESPEEIKYLIEEIEVLNLVLSGVNRGENASENNDLPDIPDPALNRCLELCQKGAKILQSLVLELDAGIGKRKRVGGLKAVLKRA